MYKVLWFSTYENQPFYWHCSLQNNKLSVVTSFWPFINDKIILLLKMENKTKKKLLNMQTFIHTIYIQNDSSSLKNRLCKHCFRSFRFTLLLQSHSLENMSGASCRGTCTKRLKFCPSRSRTERRKWWGCVEALGGAVCAIFERGDMVPHVAREVNLDQRHKGVGVIDGGNRGLGNKWRQ